MIHLTTVVKDNYSQFLYQTLLCMLAVNPQQRHSFLQLYELMRPHEQAIYDFQPFSLAGSRVQEQASRKDSPSEGRRGQGLPFSPPSQTHLPSVKLQ